MRVSRSLRAWWRSAMVPSIVWLLLVLVGTGTLLWQQGNSRQAVAERFDSGVSRLAQAGGLDVSYEPNQPQGAVFTLTTPRTSAGPRLRAEDPDMALPTS
ncbi:hypothetical protein ACWKSP_22995 [Micromonosporaceae bacterium Da 78-11]